MNAVLVKGGRYCLAMVLTSTLVACGGGGGGEAPSGKSPTPEPNIQTGVFLDNAVSGLDYLTASQSGITNDQGQYKYVQGETVTFAIGGIVLGSTPAGPVLTPIELVNGATDATHPEVVNKVRLLLSLDDDGNPDNGIRITDATRIAAADKSIDFGSPDFDVLAQALIDSVKSGATLVTATVAQDHFNSTLKTSWGTSTWGTDCWGSVCAQ